MMFDFFDLFGGVMGECIDWLKVFVEYKLFFNFDVWDGYGGV